MNSLPVNHAGTFSVLFLLLIALLSFSPGGCRAAEAEAGVEEGKLKMMKPVVDGPIDYRIMGLDDLLIGDNSNYYYLISNNYNNNGGTRRRLAPFQVCLVCKCCVSPSNPSTCASMPCCFGIDCHLPNKPFGVCAFLPKSCTCNSCAV
ncbi:hypothetical protein NMG60_11035866 [Bertholletia excelsa]